MSINWQAREQIGMAVINSKAINKVNFNGDVYPKAPYKLFCFLINKLITIPSGYKAWENEPVSKERIWD